ncbi:MAG: hypothetical protein H0U61_06705, partial [Nocardioidaceae bacterium]|nr:hypothetical protein [Nocardioidaceae bacterium]
MRLTDRAAGRLAWVVFGASVAFFVFSVVLKILNAGSKYVSHDAGDLAVEASFVLAIGSFAVAGLLITRQQPRHTIGWLMLAIGLTLAWGDLSEGYIRYALATNPGSLPGPGIVVGLSSWLWVPAIGLVGTFLILLFPDGHLPSRRWRVISWLSGLTLLGLSLAMMVAPSSYEDAGIPSVSNPFEIEALAPVLQRLGPLLALFPLCILACAASLVVRFRRSSGVKRLQLKWLATAGALAAALYLLAMLASSVGPGARDPEPGWVTTLTDVALVCFTVIPVAIGVAVLKHGLYDIDVVINKALVLGVLAAFITAVYVAIVVGVGSLVGRGDEPNLALSIAATAVVAVAFQPVRDRVQRFANRLVYGSRATPYEVLSNFADRVGGSYDAAELLPMM